MARQKTDERILGVAQKLLASGGYTAISFDAIARDLSISKQAVLYWFPSKADLLAALFVRLLGAEADAAEACLIDTTSQAAAISEFVRTIIAFHTRDLDRFRVMYLAPQTVSGPLPEEQNAEILDKIHQTTSRLYGALAARLDGPPEDARRRAFTIHTSVLGAVMMLGLSDGIGDPLAHSQDDITAALIAQLTA